MDAVRTWTGSGGMGPGVGGALRSELAGHGIGARYARVWYRVVRTIAGR